MIYHLLCRLGVPESWIVALDEWTDRMYYRSCKGPRIWWRFWFEVTGQGRAARRYRRAIGRNKWRRISRPTSYHRFRKENR